MIKAWFAFWWLVSPLWVWFILTRNDEDLELVGVFVCVGCLILLLLGV